MKCNIQYIIQKFSIVWDNSTQQILNFNNQHFFLKQVIYERNINRDRGSCWFIYSKQQPGLGQHLCSWARFSMCTAISHQLELSPLLPECVSADSWNKECSQDSTPGSVIGEEGFQVSILTTRLLYCLYLDNSIKGTTVLCREMLFISGFEWLFRTSCPPIRPYGSDFLTVCF